MRIESFYSIDFHYVFREVTQIFIMHQSLKQLQKLPRTAPNIPEQPRTTPNTPEQKPSQFQAQNRLI